MKHFFSTLMLVTALLCMASPASAQRRGNLRGKVTDQTGSVLPGANVLVDGTTLGAATDIDGIYLLQGITPGDSVKITVVYLGYEPVTRPVRIVAGETATLNFQLIEAANSIDGVVISAVVDGQQRALNQQRNSDNMMSVLSSDQMGRFPDLNVAEALQRLSGVTISRERGEGKTVQLRGTPANFTNINVNGEQIIGTSEEGGRAESLDLIPSDILASMEVQKTLLPSNDGDAIAGVVNMRTSTARSLKARGMIDLSSGYNVLRGKVPYNIKGSYSQRFGANHRNPDGRFGIAASASYYRSSNGYDRLEAQTWKEVKTLNGDDHQKEGKYGENEGKTYLPLDFRYRYQEGTRQRVGASLTFDYAPTVNTKFVLSGMFNHRGDLDTRYRNRTRLDKSDNYYLYEDGRLGVDRLQKILQVTDQDIKTDNFNLNLDGESVIGSWKIDGGVFFSTSRREANSAQYGFQTPQWRNGKAPTNLAGDKFPSKEAFVKKEPLAWVKSYQSRYLELDETLMYEDKPLDDLSYYEFYTLDNNNVRNKGRNITGRLNASKNYFIGTNASTLSFGVKGKFMHSERYKAPDSEIFDVTAISKNDDLSLKYFLYKEQLSADFLNGHISYGASPDPDKVHDWKAKNPERFSTNAYRTGSARDSFFYDADEHVFSGYVMNKIQFKKVMAIIGVRVEHTKVDYKANSVYRYDPAILGRPDNPNNDIHWNGGQIPLDEWEALEQTSVQYKAYESTRADSTVNYTVVLPNIQFKWDVAKNTILRLAYTTGYSRPDVINLVPSVDMNTDLGRVTMGNPNLKAAYSHNLDFLFEQYLKNVGLISGGVFYKHINRFQYQREGSITDPNNPYYSTLNADGTPFNMVQQMNGDAAKLFGAEITLNSNLTFLPGFLRNLVFTSNYTYTHSKAKVNDDRGELRFPGQAAHTANLALAYSSKRLTVQLSANYNGEFIYALGSNAAEDLWVDARWQLDANASYRIGKGITIYAEATNLLNTPAFTYMGDKSRVYELEFTSQVVRAGISYRF